MAFLKEMRDRWQSWSRSERNQKMTDNRLGYIEKNLNLDSPMFREGNLELYDAYYESRQYCGMPKWTETQNTQGGYRKVRERSPLIIYSLPKLIVSRLTAKLVGDKNFPKIKVAEDPDAEAFFNAILKASKLQMRIAEPIRRGLAASSVFIRYYMSDGAFKIEWWCSKYCYPVFQDNGDLKQVNIVYCAPNEDELDDMGQPKKYWYRIYLGMERDIIFKPIPMQENCERPEFPDDEDDVDPEEMGMWEVENEVVHGFGFVQGSWYRTLEKRDTPDGYSLIEDVLGFFDEVNYSMSQSSTAVSYNQDPQIILSKMQEDDISNLVRSSAKAWNLGKEGQASFLESGLVGVERAVELRDKMRLNIQDITRVVMLDPEKMVGSAQSGKAMEVLHQPFVEVIYELRPSVESLITEILQKLAVMVIMTEKQGLPIPITMPPGYQLSSLNFELIWPPVFAMTMQDLKDKVSVASAATASNLMSRATMTKWLADDFNVTDVEAEISMVDTQKVINPFGGF
jgi:hypothetical protein